MTAPRPDPVTTPGHSSRIRIRYFYDWRLTSTGYDCYVCIINASTNGFLSQALIRNAADSTGKRCDDFEARVFSAVSEVQSALGVGQLELRL